MPSTTQTPEISPDENSNGTKSLTFSPQSINFLIEEADAYLPDATVLSCPTVLLTVTGFMPVPSRAFIYSTARVLLAPSKMSLYSGNAAQIACGYVSPSDISLGISSPDAVFNAFEQPISLLISPHSEPNTSESTHPSPDSILTPASAKSAALDAEYGGGSSITRSAPFRTAALALV